MLNRILAMTVLAGAAAVASAGGPNEDTALPAVKGEHRMLNINGGPVTRSLSLQTVYDTTDLNATGAPAYAGLSSVPPYYADWGTLDLPRVGQGTLGTFGQLVEEVTFGISNSAGVNTNDVEIIFWDNPRIWEVGGVAGTGGFQASSSATLGGFIVQLPQPTSLFPTFDVWTVTGLSALSTPIVLSDNYFGFTIRTFVSGTSTLDSTAVNIFNTDEGGPVVGWSEDRFARDVDANGVIPETECNRVFTGASNPANMFLGVAVNFCDSDFDGSGFSDTDDFDAMVQAYEAGC
ncbi:MAG: hypothetical protein GIKADHBN_02048 [Phycisphaerales bacterium]|nr:hypothetical protein [Phycisphaerales bacterium]